MQHLEKIQTSIYFSIEMENLNCEFHPTRNATLKCEDCGKLLCLECNRVHRIRHSGTEHSSGYTEKFNICPFCYCSRIEKKNIVGFIVLIVMGIIMVSIFSNVFSNMSSIGPEDDFFNSVSVIFL